jgi:hypothetical protein
MDTYSNDPLRSVYANLLKLCGCDNRVGDHAGQSEFIDDFKAKMAASEQSMPPKNPQTALGADDVVDGKAPERPCEQLFNEQGEEVTAAAPRKSVGDLLSCSLEVRGMAELSLSIRFEEQEHREVKERLRLEAEEELQTADEKERLRLEADRFEERLEEELLRLEAEAEGLRVLSVADAAAEADLIMILAPDQYQRTIYAEEIEPNLQEGDALFGGGIVLSGGVGALLTDHAFGAFLFVVGVQFFA